MSILYDLLGLSRVAIIFLVTCAAAVPALAQPKSSCTSRFRQNSAGSKSSSSSDMLRRRR